MHFIFSQFLADLDTVEIRKHDYVNSRLAVGATQGIRMYEANRRTVLCNELELQANLAARLDLNLTITKISVSTYVLSLRDPMLSVEHLLAEAARDKPRRFASLDAGLRYATGVLQARVVELNIG